MEFDTLDATQAIFQDEFDDEEDAEISASQKKPVGGLILQVKSHNYLRFFKFACGDLDLFYVITCFYELTNFF
jgi:hypothetical protein